MKIKQLHCTYLWQWNHPFLGLRSLKKEFTGTDYRIDKFIVSGVSKRGWAAWLATIADQRIAAIIPIVIDIYNINAQFSKLNKVYTKSLACCTLSIL